MFSVTKPNNTTSTALSQSKTEPQETKAFNISVVCKNIHRPSFILLT